jgi:hypothetical protein
MIPPLPVPALVSHNVAGVGAGAGAGAGVTGVATTTWLNVAVTVTALFPSTVHGPVPEHVPLQPAKVEPGAGVAVSVTRVPPGYVPLQALPQLIPEGLLVTVPLPLPDFVTLTVESDGIEPHASSEYGDSAELL